jgi:hypothetical protein
MPGGHSEGENPMKHSDIPDPRAERRDRAKWKERHGMRFDGGAPLATHRPPSRKQLQRLVKKGARK